MTLVKSKQLPKSKPTWSKIDPDGSRFLTYDPDLTKAQLQTLDKIVENIELCYDYSNNSNISNISNSKSKISNNNDEDYTEMSESYLYSKPKDPSATWHWRDASERSYYQSHPHSNPNGTRQQFIYNTYSKETADKMRAYLTKFYLDLIESTKNQIKINNGDKNETSRPPPAFPRPPSPQNSSQQSIKNNGSSKYERKLLDVFTNITKDNNATNINNNLARQDSSSSANKESDSYEAFEYFKVSSVASGDGRSGKEMSDVERSNVGNGKKYKNGNSFGDDDRTFKLERTESEVIHEFEKNLSQKSTSEEADDTDLDQDESARSAFKAPSFKNSGDNKNGKIYSDFISEKVERRRDFNEIRYKDANYFKK